MSPETVMNIAHQAMMITLYLGAPMLLAALLIGLLVSLFQAATQIGAGDRRALAAGADHRLHPHPVPEYSTPGFLTR